MVDNRHIDDTDLTVLLQQGNQTAFTTIYNTYWKLLFRNAYRVLNDTAAAEDIVQNVFFSLWKRREEAKILNLKAYLQQATRFSVFQAIREQKHDDSFYNRLALVTTDIIADNPLLFKEQQELLQSIIESLPDDCKEAFRLSREEQMTYKQVAALLNISEKTVEKRLSKSLKHIRNSLTLSSCLIVLINY